MHRRSIHPAMRVCREWGSLLLNDKTQVVSESQECTEWLQSFFTQTGFSPSAQAAVVRAFVMGAGAWALRVDAGGKDVRIRRCDARMAMPPSWDEGRVTECAFVTWAFYRGRPRISCRCTCFAAMGRRLPQPRFHLPHLRRLSLSPLRLRKAHLRHLEAGPWLHFPCLHLQRRNPRQ